MAEGKVVKKSEGAKELELEVEMATSEVPTAPTDLGIMSYLVREVDCERMTMPQARQALSEWWQKQTDKTATREPGKTRMRRLKQITDGMFEEFWTLVGSQS